MKKIISKFFVICFSLFFIFSCKKVDKQIPQLTIITPSISNSFNVLDTINIKAEVSDDEEVESISISLLDMNSNVIVSPYSPRFPRGKASLIFGDDLILNDKTIASGEYRLRITVSDGKNVASKEVSISISEIVRKKIAYVFFQNNGVSNSVYVTDSINQVSLMGNVQGTFVGASVFSSSKKIIVSTNQTPKLSYYDFSNFNNYTSINDNENITAYHKSDSLVYIGNTAGYVRGYDATGIEKINFKSSIEFYFPVRIFESKDYLFCIEQSTSGQKILEIRNRYTGGLLKTKDITFNPIAMANKSNGNIVMLTSSATSSQLIEYDYIQNTISTLTQIGESSTDIFNYSESVLLVSSTSKVFAYNINSGVLSEFILVSDAKKIMKDEVNNLILLLKSNELNLVNIDSPTQNFSIPLPNSITRMDVLYNK